jgi:hypothetical protein
LLRCMNPLLGTKRKEANATTVAFLRCRDHEID